MFAVLGILSVSLAYQVRKNQLLSRACRKRSHIRAIKVSPSIGGVCSDTATAASIFTRTELIDSRSARSHSSNNRKATSSTSSAET
ncbi:hypothetical protein [Microcoleus sp. LEGE 07076]|uniref:hypothetical protein n=1 Tax=Microcoleus sp. LEGE 07076 TaxID=915322 RepID=UPI001D157FAC|nr:hypothetical protein [Microcoleus sp. LEGE 07076]